MVCRHVAVDDYCIIDAIIIYNIVFNIVNLNIISLFPLYSRDFYDIYLFNILRLLARVVCAFVNNYNYYYFFFSNEDKNIDNIEVRIIKLDL